MKSPEDAVTSILHEFREFVFRDFFYLLGGSTAIVAWMWSSDMGLDYLANGVFLVFLASLGYVLGYALQEAFSLTPLVTTQPATLSRLMRWLASRFAPHYNWSSKLSNLDPLELLFCYAQHSPRELNSLVTRTTNLKQVCTAMAPSLFATAIIFFANGYFYNTDTGVSLNLLGLMALLASLLLALIAKIKNAQQYLIMIRLAKECEECDIQIDEPD